MSLPFLKDRGMPLLMDLADVAEKTVKLRNVWRPVGEVPVRFLRRMSEAGG